jgi:hypothetical protein
LRQQRESVDMTRYDRTEVPVIEGGHKWEAEPLDDRDH